MTSTTNFIGVGKRNANRVLQPPGGECSDIFGVSANNSSAGSSRHPSGDSDSSYKGKQQSSVFVTDGNGVSNGHTNGTGRRLSNENSHEKLFGPALAVGSPKKVVDRMKSSIFNDQAAPMIETPTHKKYVRRNPITGSVDVVGDQNGVHEQTNGYSNGNGNGYGHDSSASSSPPSTPTQPNAVRVRNPPGGKSSGIF